jgi:hypothetical protein
MKQKREHTKTELLKEKFHVHERPWERWLEGGQQ